MYRVLLGKRILFLVLIKVFNIRKIEIAGGREVFSQSRCKAIRKSRSDDKMNARKQKSYHESGAIWELRNK